MSDAAGEREVLSYAGGSQLARVGDLFREGGLLVVRSGGVLPRKCVICSGGVEEGAAGMMLAFTWDSSFTVTKASTLEMRREGSVRAFLCGTHRRRWRLGRAAGVVGMLVSGLVMGGGILVASWSELSDVPRHTGAGIAVMVAGFALMIAALFLFTLRTRTLGCVKIEEGYLYLSGVGEGLLAGLGEVPAQGS